MHLVAGRREIDRAELEAVQPDAPAELHRAAAELRDGVDDADALRVEQEAAVDVLQAVRERVVADAPAGDRRVSREDGMVERPAHLRVERRGARAADRAVERLQDPEVRVAGRVERDPLLVQVDRAAEVELRLIAGELEAARLDDVLVQRELDRPVVRGGIVEQLELQPVDRRLDHEVVDVAAAERADRAVGDDRVERREPRDQTDVRIERRVGEMQREVDVLLGRQREAALARTDRRRDCALSSDSDSMSPRSESVPRPVRSFVGDEEVGDRGLHVVARRRTCPRRSR